MLDYALDWASRGFKLFPLHPGTKRPVWKAWYDHATSDPERIKEIWAERPYNIGVLTDDLIVIDVDVKSGKNGIASLLELDIPLDTLTVRTPSGGLHLYFKNAGQPVANSVGKLGEGLDVRGFHGFVIAPGSLLGAARYRLDTDQPILGRGSWASTLDSPTARYTNGVDVELDDPAAVEHARHWLEHRDPAVEGRGGDDHTYRTALKLRDFGLSEDTAFALLQGWNDTCEPPWPADSLRTKIDNAYAYGKSPPGAASPQHLFAGVDIPVDVEPSDDELLHGFFWHGEDWAGSVEWLYHELLPTTGVCILTAPSNAGKTFVALDLADSLAAGRPFFGVPPESVGGTVMLVGEAYGSVKMRMAALGASATPLPLVTRYVGALAARGAWNELGKRLVAVQAEMLRRHGVPIRLIILDTLSSSGILDKEDDNAMAATVLKAFADLSTDLKALFLILHHPPKSGEGERGASAIRNNADYVMAIKREGTAAVRDIEMNKSRDGETKMMGTFTLVPKVIGEDAKGRPLKTMIVSPGEPRIRESRAGSSFAALLIESVEWALIQGGEIVEGETWTEDELAKEIFASRWEGKRDRTRINEAFKQATNYCLGAGSLEGLRKDGRTYLKLRRINL